MSGDVRHWGHKISLSMHGEDVDGDPYELTIEGDSDSSVNPKQWIWMMYAGDDEPWFRLTYREAAEARDRLNYLLEVWDTLTDEQKATLDIE